MYVKPDHTMASLCGPGNIILQWMIHSKIIFHTTINYSYFCLIKIMPWLLGNQILTIALTSLHGTLKWAFHFCSLGWWKSRYTFHLLQRGKRKGNCLFKRCELMGWSSNRRADDSVCWPSTTTRLSTMRCQQLLSVLRCDHGIAVI